MSDFQTARTVAQAIGWDLFSCSRAMVIFRRKDSHDLVCMSHDAVADLAVALVDIRAGLAGENVVPLRRSCPADARQD